MGSGSESLRNSSHRSRTESNVTGGRSIASSNTWRTLTLLASSLSVQTYIIVISIQTSLSITSSIVTGGVISTTETVIGALNTSSSVGVKNVSVITY